MRRILFYLLFSLLLVGGISAWRVFACGDTQVKRQPDVLGGKCFYDLGNTREISKTVYWNVYWLDGYVRPVDVTDVGECKLITGRNAEGCWPIFEAPYFIKEPNNIGAWNEKTYTGYFSAFGTICGHSITPNENWHRHQCASVSENEGGGNDKNLTICCVPTADGTVCCDSPVLIDLAGNGFSLSEASAGVRFDLDSNGSREPRGWTTHGSDDGWLALDRNLNGTIDDGSELFGNYTPQSVSDKPNGFLALTEYDKPTNGGDGNGLIDGGDSIFSRLLVWQDMNHNGVSEPEELHTLAALGLVRFELDYKESRLTDEYGNQFRYRAKVWDAKGEQVGRWAWDVFLVTQ